MKLDNQKQTVLGGHSEFVLDFFEFYSPCRSDQNDEMSKELNLVFMGEDAFSFLVVLSEQLMRLLLNKERPCLAGTETSGC